MAPQYDLEKLKSEIDKKTWERAVLLYNGKKVVDFEESYAGYTAQVLGTEPYDVAVSENNFSQGDCSCFVGRQGICCKHIVALAIYAVNRGKPVKN